MSNTEVSYIIKTPDNVPMQLPLGTSMGEAEAALVGHSVLHKLDPFTSDGDYQLYEAPVSDNRMVWKYIVAVASNGVITNRWRGRNE